MVSPADKAHAVRAAGQIVLNTGFILAITKFTQHYLVRTRDAIIRNKEFAMGVKASDGVKP